MSDPEVRHTTALAALRVAERQYAEAETKLIQARRYEYETRGGTKYAKMLRDIQQSAPETK